MVRVVLVKEGKMNHFKAILAVTFVILFTISCAPAATNPASQPATSVELSNPSNRITVPVGVSFTINVKANPTTGYSWQAGFDQSLLKLVKQYTPSSTGAIGAGGIESFEFQGMRAGETEIYLNYKRSFEPNNPSLETKIFKVTIK
jgi:predicted secreted protein